MQSFSQQRLLLWTPPSRRIPSKQSKVLDFPPQVFRQVWQYLPANVRRKDRKQLRIDRKGRKGLIFKNVLKPWRRLAFPRANQSSWISGFGVGGDMESPSVTRCKACRMGSVTSGKAFSMVCSLWGDGSWFRLLDHGGGFGGIQTSFHRHILKILTPPAFNTLLFHPCNSVCLRASLFPSHKYLQLPSITPPPFAFDSVHSSCSSKDHSSAQT